MLLGMKRLTVEKDATVEDSMFKEFVVFCRSSCSFESEYFFVSGNNILP